jgi:hypothetical protein
MPKCTEDKIDFGRVGRRVIEAEFSGGELSSDGGLLLLRQLDRHLGLSAAAARAIPDPRDPERIRHGLRDLLAQRLYALCCGYEDLNDHKALRDDVLMQTALGRDQALASAPTFSRLENRATRAQAWALHGVLVDQFVAAHEQPAEEVVLDVDAWDVPLPGNQELSPLHAYYDHHCYLAAVRVLRPGDAGVLPATGQDRCGQARRSRAQAARAAAAQGLAEHEAMRTTNHPPFFPPAGREPQRRQQDKEFPPPMAQAISKLMADRSDRGWLSPRRTNHFECVYAIGAPTSRTPQGQRTRLAPEVRMCGCALPLRAAAN